MLLSRIARSLRRPRFAIPIVAVVAIACSSGGGGDPAEAVQDYLRAKVAADGETIRRLLCSMMESAFEQEANTFKTVSDAQIENMNCSRVGESDVVRCIGKITAKYGTEQTEFELTSYRVVEEDGEWKWCGEAPE
jgi:hypothetical protein